MYIASDSLPHKYVGYFVSSETKKQIYKGGPKTEDSFIDFF